MVASSVPRVGHCYSINSCSCSEYTHIIVPSQVVRRARADTSGGHEDASSPRRSSISMAERGVGMQEALRCLVLLTSTCHPALYTVLGLSSSPSTPAMFDTLFALAAAEGGYALQVSLCEF